MTAKKSFPLLLCTALTFGVLAAGCGGSKGSTDAASFCSSFHSLMTKVQQTRTPAQFQADADGFSQLESSAPAAIKGDWKTMSDAINEVANSYTHDTAPLQTSAASAADQRLADWAKANCQA